MKQNEIKFNIDEITKEVTASGFPELEDKKGSYEGDDIAMFWGEGWHNYEFFIANTKTCKIRKLSTENGTMLVDDNEMDLKMIKEKCLYGYNNAKNKNIKYATVNRYDGFKNGICVISWVLFPDGRYFDDSDGFGGESNNEECVYAIMNTNLDIIIPFRPVDNIKEYLRTLRSCK